MKIRSGFVTNSSSSSFLISFKKLPTLPKRTVKAHPELEAYADLVQSAILKENYSFDEHDCAREIRDEDDLKAFFKEYVLPGLSTWSYDDDRPVSEFLSENPEEKELYDQALAVLKEGKRLVYRTVPYSEKAVMKLLRSLISTERIACISEWEH